MLLKFSDKRELGNYLLYSMGLLVSQFGTVLYTFVMSLYVLKITNSGMLFSINLAISIIPVIFVTPFAGVLADKCNKKLIVISMDILSGLLLIGVYLYASRYGLNIVLIYLTTLLLGAFGSLFDISLGAAKVNLVEEGKLVLMNSTTDIIRSMTMILGPLVGGLLFVITDLKVFILINGISFIISAFSEHYIDFKYLEHEVQDIKLNVIEDIKAGYYYVSKRSDLKTIIGIFLIINISLSLSVTVPLPYIINNVLELGSRNFGIIEAGFPIGIMIGALYVSKVMQKYSYIEIFNNSLILFSAVIALFGAILLVKRGLLSNQFYMIYYFISTVITGVIVSLIDIPVVTYIQTKIDKNYLGRVSSIVMSIVKIATPLVYIISGFLIDVIRVELVIFTGSLITLMYFMIMKYNANKLIEVDSKIPTDIHA